MGDIISKIDLLLSTVQIIVNSENLAFISPQEDLYLIVGTKMSLKTSICNEENYRLNRAFRPHVTNSA